ncbi:hypothetical protein BBK36DRAFT_1156253 [Trichoderma citrinoviride]|uniref:Uncharacterized protein n=1 Tax=Trichoderma citrinoviride TaxID=58853 RepID=A0A2T4BK48_9HYPO|nr:hypothetical protein BBK36DRAFT_1156253 [Trichoderma citrinoviride]PTB69685.1 hypothetical protein BBK36DRAFT_1156253 [Trichoderma citrinoviride]
MPPKGKGRKAAAAKKPVRRSERAYKNATPPAEEEILAGPERFAPWFPLLQKIRKDNWKRQNNISLEGTNLHPAQTQAKDEFPEILENIHRSLSAAPKVYDNKLVPPSEYPAVQLQNGVLTPELSRRPRNLEWLRTRLRTARHIADWPVTKWQSYSMHSYLNTTKEAVMCRTMPLFQEYSHDPSYIRTFCQCFEDFPEYVPFSRGIEKPCPGFAQGFKLDAYPCVDVEYLSASVCFTRSQTSLVHPHLAGDFTYGDLKALEAASARHGAAMVYMRNIALAHMQKEILPDIAEVMTFTTNGVFINFYAHYESRSSDGKVVYHQYPILTANLLGSYHEFLQGVAMLRNCQDHALFMATHLRDALEKYHIRNGVSAWTYRLDQGEHILSESEDSEMGEAHDVRDFVNGDGACSSDGESTDGSSSDEDESYDTAYEDQSPRKLRVRGLMMLRPKRGGVLRREQRDSSSQKRRAGKGADGAAKKKRR